MDLSPVTPDSIIVTVVYTVLLFWGVWVGLLACRGPIRQVGSQTADTPPAKLFDEFHFDRGVGITFVVRLR